MNVHPIFRAARPAQMERRAARKALFATLHTVTRVRAFLLRLRQQRAMHRPAYEAMGAYHDCPVGRVVAQHQIPVPPAVTQTRDPGPAELETHAIERRTRLEHGRLQENTKVARSKLTGGWDAAPRYMACKEGEASCDDLARLPPYSPQRFALRPPLLPERNSGKLRWQHVDSGGGERLF